MATVFVSCPHCHYDMVIKRGKTENGKQRYLCLRPECPMNTFILDYTNNCYLPEVKDKIIDMAVNGSGIRDTARVLEISPGTVISHIKSMEALLESVNRAVLETLSPNEIIVDIQKVEDAELDEMWSYVGSRKTNVGFGMPSITRLKKFWSMPLASDKTLSS